MPRKLKWTRDKTTDGYRSGDWEIRIGGERGGRIYAWFLRYKGDDITTSLRGKAYTKIFDRLSDAKRFAEKREREQWTPTSSSK